MQENDDSEETKEAVQEMLDSLGTLSPYELSLLPPIKKSIKGYKVRLRYASVRISSISSNGLVTLSMNEPVNLVNQGKQIDQDLLMVAFRKQSDQPVAMTKWEQVAYSET